MKDYYKILRVVPDAEIEIISSAYRALCRKYHPDTYKGSDAENKMKEINEAYEVLKDPEKRKEYDKTRHSAEAEAQTKTEAEHKEQQRSYHSAQHPPSSSPSQAVKQFNEKDGAEIILIPAGDFLMGSPGSSDYPRHTVYLESYYIYAYQVTNEQFATFIKKTGYKAKGKWEKYVKSGRERHPVVNILWNDAVAYCEWAGGRLPTTAQWEKAARGNDGRAYPWGNTWDDNRCNWSIVPRLSDLYRGRNTMPVGSFPSGVSPYGVHDMAGNVWEWCNECSPCGKYHIIRGGS